MSSRRVAQSDVGRFVTDEEHGIGRLVDVSSGIAQVRYFRGPTNSPYEDLSHDVDHVAPAELRPHTRVYLHDGRRWRVGRIDAEHPDRDGRFAVAFPNGEGELLTHDSFDVRWGQPIADPYEILAARAGESPAVYEPRLSLIDAWHRQSAAAIGVSGLVLGSVELHDHQLTVVRRVSQDNVHRYLLADEVGLGKTIEAGSLVWQSLRQRPNATILVLAPDHLRQQWAEELIDKFHTDSFPDAEIKIRPHEDPGGWPTESVDVLVVDEAHHMTRAGRNAPEVSAEVVRLAHEARDVFLLSATPVRSNEAAFLDLLHLLDPKNYQPSDLESFTRRVEMRDELALIHHALSPELDEFDFSLYAEQLRASFPDDIALLALVERASERDDEERPAAILRVKDYLSETYRLHHRLLRTRRTDQISETLGVRGRRRGRPFTVEVPDETDDLRRDLIDSFRPYLAERLDEPGADKHELIDALREICQACGALPHALLELADAEPESSSAEVFGDWLASYGDAWRRHLESAAPVILERTVREIGRMAISRSLGAVVVSSSYSVVAGAVADALETAFGAHRVARHLKGQARQENAMNVDRWRNEEACRVLVCDASAEEGINLQAAAVVMHLDLPWDMSRLEQRLGRADRFSLDTSEPVESMVFAYGEQDYASGWFLHAADACGVFERSVSSLQYVLADIEADLLAGTVRGGPSVLESDLLDRQQSLEEEARRIAAHDSLDSVSGRHGSLNRRLIKEDSDRALGSAVTQWLTGVGAKVRRPSRGTIEIGSRPRPQVPFSLELEIAQWTGKELALSRDASVDRHVPILRPGHGLLDAIVEHVLADERGIAFAFMRPLPGCWPPVPVFRTDFMVRSSGSDPLAHTAAGLGLDSLLALHRETLIPPTVETAYTSATGSEAVADNPATAPYSKANGDRNLVSRPDLFSTLTSHVDWDGICKDGLSAAREAIDARDSVTRAPVQAASELRSIVDTEIAIVRTRVAAGLEADGERITDLEALLAAVPERLEMVVEPIGCGVVVLADPARSSS